MIYSTIADLFSAWRVWWRGLTQPFVAWVERLVGVDLPLWSADAIILFGWLIGFETKRRLFRRAVEQNNQQAKRCRTFMAWYDTPDFETMINLDLDYHRDHLDQLETHARVEVDPKGKAKIPSRFVREVYAKARPFLGMTIADSPKRTDGGEWPKNSKMNDLSRCFFTLTRWMEQIRAIAQEWADLASEEVSRWERKKKSMQREQRIAMLGLWVVLFFVGGDLALYFIHLWPEFGSI
ncbi:MAG: hypothetical protein AAFR51_08920 [Pseudomonadota bacterium]